MPGILYYSDNILFRSSFLCGTDDSSGRIVPKICCPSAALTANQKPETSTPKEPENKYQSHPGIQLIADKDSCGKGKPDQRIVGGQDAPQGKFPWLVNLGYQQDSKGEKVFKCGGSLIGPRHIVTAAHCVTQLPRGFVLTTIRVGEHDLDKDVDCDPPATCPPPQDIAVEDIIFHPSYGSPEAFQNDIAVVALSRNVTQNEFVVPICLPWEDDNESYLDGGRSGPLSPITEVAGWGATTITGRKPANILQYLDVSVTDAQECKNIYKERGGILGEKQICAGGVKGKVSIHFQTLQNKDFHPYKLFTGLLRWWQWQCSHAEPPWLSPEWPGQVGPHRRGQLRPEAVWDWGGARGEVLDKIENM